MCDDFYWIDRATCIQQINKNIKLVTDSSFHFSNNVKLKSDI